MKKEYLSSLQPRLNSIMQVLEPHRSGRTPKGCVEEVQHRGWLCSGDIAVPVAQGWICLLPGLLRSIRVYAAIPAELRMEELLNGPFPGESHAVPAPCGCPGREEQEKELGYFQIQKFSSKESCQPSPGGLPCPWLCLTLHHGCCAGFQSHGKGG